MKKILIAIPSFDGKLPPELYSFISSQKIDGYEIHSTISKRTLVNRARNNMIKQAIDGGYDYILFMDDDNIPENPDTLKILLEMDVDIATGAYLSRVGEPKFILYYKTDGIPRYVQIDKIDGNIGPIQEVGATGGGCLLVKIDVFKKLYEKYDIYQFEDKLTYFYEGKEYICDRPLIDLSKVTKCAMGGDVTFCDRATSEGFKIFVNLRCPLLHIGEPNIRQITNKFYNFD